MSGATVFPLFNTRDTVLTETPATVAISRCWTFCQMTFPMFADVFLSISQFFRRNLSNLFSQIFLVIAPQARRIAWSISLKYTRMGYPFVLTEAFPARYPDYTIFFCES